MRELEGTSRGVEGTWRGLGGDLEWTWRGLEGTSGDLRGLGRDLSGLGGGLEGTWNMDLAGSMRHSFPPICPIAAPSPQHGLVSNLHVSCT